MPIDPTAPVASAPADRLTLMTAVIRSADASPSALGIGTGGCCGCLCSADEA